MNTFVLRGFSVVHIALEALLVPDDVVAAPLPLKSPSDWRHSDSLPWKHGRFALTMLDHGCVSKTYLTGENGGHKGLFPFQYRVCCGSYLRTGWFLTCITRSLPTYVGHGTLCYSGINFAWQRKDAPAILEMLRAESASVLILKRGVL